MTICNKKNTHTHNCINITFQEINTKEIIIERIPFEISDDRLIAGSSQISDDLKEVDTARVGGSVKRLVHVAKEVDNGPANWPGEAKSLGDK